ncbi:hypothetical protein [Streptomyces alfalfae]|uniref:Uncharacterized protein n=1 Tax=Streptomyces alfalfae TaxID=1642299 RepID=A0A7T4TYE9_9ACTN|nr:hypothetical protein [Streptomyces alfalfae]QQC90214.1 hypothetical protein I8755_18715 [Streptomyces alfalfae]QUI32693.1 hypothetical protein H9W91_18905 [Streptomyces alfalfae]
MPRDPYAALHALLRAEAVRTTPPEATRAPEGRRTEAPEARAPREDGRRPRSGTPAPEIR